MLRQPFTLIITMLLFVGLSSPALSDENSQKETDKKRIDKLNIKLVDCNEIDSKKPFTVIVGDCSYTANPILIEKKDPDNSQKTILENEDCEWTVEKEKIEKEKKYCGHHLTFDNKLYQEMKIEFKKGDYIGCPKNKGRFDKEEKTGNFKFLLYRIRMMQVTSDPPQNVRVITYINKDCSDKTYEEGLITGAEKLDTSPPFQVRDELKVKVCYNLKENPEEKDYYETYLEKITEKPIVHNKDKMVNFLREPYRDNEYEKDLQEQIAREIVKNSCKINEVKFWFKKTK